MCMYSTFNTNDIYIHSGLRPFDKLEKTVPPFPAHAHFKLSMILTTSMTVFIFYLYIFYNIRPEIVIINESTQIMNENQNCACYKFVIRFVISPIFIIIINILCLFFVCLTLHILSGCYSISKPKFNITIIHFSMEF